MKHILLVLLLSLFSVTLTGCLENVSKEKIENKQTQLQQEQALLDREIRKARHLADRQKELALVKMKRELEELALAQNKTEAELKKELAKINAQKEIALQKTQNELKFKELEISKEKMRVEMENQKLLDQQALKQEQQLYVILLIGFLLFLVFVGTLLYFYKKRKDKLIAYEDNLEKYFRQKENEARMHIADKIIDTMASGKLDPRQEERLLGVLKAPMHQEMPQEISKTDETEGETSSDAIDIEVDDDLPSGK